MFVRGHKRTSTDDLELVARIKAGQSVDRHLGEIFDRYAHLVLGVCMKYLKDVEEAKDMVMHVFEILPSKLERYEVKEFKGWLLTVSRNECLMRLRSDKSKDQHQQRYIEEEKARVESDEDLHLMDTHTNGDGQIDDLHKALEGLKPEQRTCVELFYLEKLSYVEVAERTGYDMKQVKSYIQNGKRNLKILMEAKDE